MKIKLPKFNLMAPYAAIAAVMAVLTGTVLVFFTPLHESAFQFGSGIVGGLFVTGAMAAGYHAYKTSVIMVGLGLVMFLVLAVGVDAESFKDIAFKGLASGVASGTIVVIKTLLDRFKEMANE